MSTKQLNNGPFLVLGAQGQLGKEFVARLTSSGCAVTAPVKSDADIRDTERICALAKRAQASVLINCAAYNEVDEAQTQKETAFEINARAVGRLAEKCREVGVFFVHYSSDYVFDGRKNSPYVEDDEPHPLNCYGESKFEGERAVFVQTTDALVFRLSWVIGEGGRNFLSKLRGWAAQNAVLRIATDEISVPTFVGTVVDCTLLSLEKKLTGLYHLTNSGVASRFDLAQAFIREMGLANELRRHRWPIFRPRLFARVFGNEQSEAFAGPGRVHSRLEVALKTIR